MLVRSATPTLHTGADWSKNPWLRGRCVRVCFSSAPTTSAGQPHKEIKILLILPPFSSCSFLSTPSWDCVECVCACVSRGRLRVLSEWLRVCVNVCVSSRVVTVCHTGERAGRQRCVHFIIAVMTEISSQEEWLPRPHTCINTPPPTSASQLTLTNTSWTMVRWTVPLAGTEKTSEEREREKGWREEGRKGKALVLFLAEGDSAALVFPC